MSFCGHFFFSSFVLFHCIQCAVYCTSYKHAVFNFLFVSIIWQFSLLYKKFHIDSINFRYTLILDKCWTKQVQSYCAKKKTNIVKILSRLYHVLISNLVWLLFSHGETHMTCIGLKWVVMSQLLLSMNDI